MTDKNYSKILDDTIAMIKREGQRPSLLLHACCAPCSSYTLEYLAEIFDITVFFFNPNISPPEDYDFRLKELERLVGEMLLPNGIKVLSGRYDPQEFYDMAKGREDIPEGGARCYDCYRLRLRETAVVAAKHGFDYFTTTLSISPYKNAKWLNEIGEIEAEEAGVKYLFSDFKKKNGYKRSCELSEIYGLYRQDYCGCEFSKKQAEQRKKEHIVKESH